jgi:hypothetical protein
LGRAQAKGTRGSNGEEGYELEKLMDIFEETGEACLAVTHKEITKHYATNEIWELITRKGEAIETGDRPQVESPKKQIAKAAGEDKQKSTLAEHEQIDGNNGFKWEGLQKMSAPFNPKRTKFKHNAGDLISQAQLAEEAARYLAEEQWAQPSRAQASGEKKDQYDKRPIHHGGVVPDQELDLEDMDRVIDIWKNNQAQGPDKTKANLIKRINKDSEEMLLKFYNQAFD